MYVVVENFTDLQDNNHDYRKDSLYPFEKKEINKDRINELSSNKNKQKKILIKEIDSLVELNINQLIEYAEIEKIDLRDAILEEINSKMDELSKNKTEELNNGDATKKTAKKNRDK